MSGFIVVDTDTFTLAATLPTWTSAADVARSLETSTFRPHHILTEVRYAEIVNTATRRDAARRSIADRIFPRARGRLRD